ncbi:DUF246 domain-containing protein, partial [Musa troglodytarum]
MEPEEWRTKATEARAEGDASEAIYLHRRDRAHHLLSIPINYDTNKLWEPADSDGWRSSSAPRSYWPPPPNESNGYLRVRCNGGLNQQRSAICNAVVAARIMNATLVLPELDTNSFWHDERFVVLNQYLDQQNIGIYDAEHFIGSLRYDIHIVQSLPDISVNGKRKKIRSFQIRPPRDAPLSWYTTIALKKMREHGSVYLTPFSHRLAEEIDDPELQRLRCRVGLVLQAMGFNNSARIYLAAGELFGGERFIKPFRAMFPHLENHSTVGPSEKLEGNARGLVGSAVDYMVSLLSDIFIPTYDGPSNFANNLMGHRLYYGFRTTIQPNRKALAPIFMDREKGRADGFEGRIRQVMFNSKFGGPHKRVHPESFYTNSWPECFCLMAPANPADKCPPHNILEILH